MSGKIIREEKSPLFSRMQNKKGTPCRGQTFKKDKKRTVKKFQGRRQARIMHTHVYFPLFVFPPHNKRSYFPPPSPPSQSQSAQFSLFFSSVRNMGKRRLGLISWPLRLWSFFPKEKNLEFPPYFFLKKIRDRWRNCTLHYVYWDLSYRDFFSRYEQGASSKRHIFLPQTKYFSKHDALLI